MTTTSTVSTAATPTPTRRPRRAPRRSPSAVAPHAASPPNSPLAWPACGAGARAVLVARGSGRWCAEVEALSSGVCGRAHR